jgi:putative SOS response-associated peptidase YedK
MCGRYSFTTPIEAVRRLFGVAGGGNLAPRYNVAPTQAAAVVRLDEKTPPGRILDHLTWGLVPSWAKDASMAARMINARAETVAEKPAFRNAFRRRRCLVPADGFYEWRLEGGAKQPYHIGFADRRPFAFAGLWEHWMGKDGSEILSFSIVTTDANELLRPLHHRMPVILEPEGHARWLDPATEAPVELLHPYRGDGLGFHAVSRHVNNVRNDDPECIAPLASAAAPSAPPPPAQGRLI